MRFVTKTHEISHPYIFKMLLPWIIIIALDLRACLEFHFFKNAYRNGNIVLVVEDLEINIAEEVHIETCQ